MGASVGGLTGVCGSGWVDWCVCGSVGVCVLTIIALPSDCSAHDN